MLDSNEIITTVQAIDLMPSEADLDKWVSFTETVSAGFDEAKRLGIGYVYKQAKRSLKDTKFEEYCRAIGVSKQVVYREIKFFDANQEVDMPETITASKYAEIKGTTPKEKIESYKTLEATLGKVPSVKDIREDKENFKKVPTTVQTETKLKEPSEIIEVELEPTKDYKVLYEREVILHKKTKDKLKKERELKDKRNKEKAELKANTVDLAPLKEAQKQLDAFWDSLHTAQRNYMGKLNKEHKRQFVIQATTEPKHYIVLGLSEEATLDEVKIAYRKLAKQLHPDMPDGDEVKFKKIAEAYKKIKELHNARQ